MVLLLALVAWLGVAVLVSVPVGRALARREHGDEHVRRLDRFAATALTVGGGLVAVALLGLLLAE